MEIRALRSLLRPVLEFDKQSCMCCSITLQENIVIVQSWVQVSIRWVTINAGFIVNPSVASLLSPTLTFLSKYTLALVQACNMLKSSRCAIALRARGKPWDSVCRTLRNSVCFSEELIRTPRIAPTCLHTCISHGQILQRSVKAAEQSRSSCLRRIRSLENRAGCSRRTRLLLSSATGYYCLNGS